MNAKLAQTAQEWVEQGTGPQMPNACERFIREVVEHVCGTRYDHIFFGGYGDTAWEIAEAWKHHTPPGVVVIDTEDVGQSQLGDLLYCRPGGMHGAAGHVGIRVMHRDGMPAGAVAENSVRKTGRTHGHLGFCSIGGFGFSRIVRLPA